jgi:hypothetical protein
VVQDLLSDHRSKTCVSNSTGGRHEGRDLKTLSALANAIGGLIVIAAERKRSYEGNTKRPGPNAQPSIGFDQGISYRERDSVSRHSCRFNNIQGFDCRGCHICQRCRAALHRLHRRRLVGSNRVTADHLPPRAGWPAGASSATAPPGGPQRRSFRTCQCWRRDNHTRRSSSSSFVIVQAH